jgi:hypothetical protein
METKIIYIIGAGRSGTTLLDIMLGNSPDIFSAGELNRFAKRRGIPHDARDRVVEQFWKQIRENLVKDNISDLSILYDVSKKFEYHTSIFNSGILNPSNGLFKQYADYQKKLFNNITKQAEQLFNKTIIVDSSKYPMRGLMLSKIFGQNISFIYIQRNPNAVVESFQKKDVEQPSKSRLNANIYLLLVNSIARSVLKKVKSTNRIAVINYEDLSQDPLSVLQKIEANLQINLQTPKKLIETTQPLNVGLLFDGNRLRLKNQIIFNKRTQATKTKGLINYFFYPLHKIMWYK